MDCFYLLYLQTPGFGGGVCQISSTLYNTALLANLEIMERHNHQLTVPYIVPGRDATLAFPSKDLKFHNNRDHYILITAFIEHDDLTFRLFGAPIEERVEIKTVEIAAYTPPIKHEFVPELAPGEEEVIEGHPGYVVQVWKTVYREDKIESEEIISVDSYLPSPKIIRRGVSRNN
ncbi:MAG: hypothetical protein CVU88_02945 [Firmicutes bacterium HGW-Firmicutes-13]|nr:MAG: hypothetical protein CVU88_02945 [Firmicutes bacterium HGW-Firmicutes-13]